MMRGRVFVTGDTHGDLTKIIDFIHKFDLKLGDSIIVLGDFGIFWRKDGRDGAYWIDLYEKECNGVHLYWLDGNHENFDIINSWNINKNYEYDNSEHIHYCPRGFITNIDVKNGDHWEAKRALFLGGADSVDKFRRIEHLSWWEDERITEKDIDGIEGDFDYVFTHCCSYSTFFDNKVYLCMLGIDDDYSFHESERVLDRLFKNINYKNHYFGHYHVDQQLDNKHTCVFNDFIELGGANG